MGKAVIGPMHVLILTGEVGDQKVVRGAHHAEGAVEVGEGTTVSSFESMGIGADG